MHEISLFGAVQPRLQLRDSEGRLLEVGGDIVPPAQLVQQELLPLSFTIFDSTYTLRDCIQSLIGRM
jgi:hypothetical protein